jgi:endonuclease YncB( thermonuclease family)
MTEPRLAVFLLLLLTLLPAQAATLTGRVIRVSDGDTLVVISANKAQHEIRLQGIDAPERGQAVDATSKAHLSERVAGKFVVVEFNKYDRYGRVVGKVLLSGEDVNLEQIEAGLAWHYRKYQGEQSPSDRVKYADAEREARRLKLGLWHDPNPVPPWEYRQAEREDKRDLQPFMGKPRVWPSP